MKISRLRALARPRQGMGALFIVAAGVIVVLAAIVGVNQFTSMTSQTRDTTAAIEMTHKTTLVAESAVDEGGYGTLALDMNNPNSGANGLYLKIRSYLPAADINADPTRLPPVFEGATGFIQQAKYSPVLTYEAMKADESLRLSSYDADSNPVYYGPLSQKPVTSNQSGNPVVLMPESNESIGIMGFAHTVFSKGYGLFKDLDQSIQFSRPYKCMLMAAPWPYTRYALFVNQCSGDMTAQNWADLMTPVSDPLAIASKGLYKKQGPAKSAFAEFFRKAQWQALVVKRYNDAMTLRSQAPTAIPTSGLNVDVNSPIVFEGDATSSALDPVVNGDPAVAALRTDMPMPAGTGFEDARLDQMIANFVDTSKTAELQAAVDTLTKLGTSLKAIGDKIKVRNVTQADFNKYFSGTATMPAFNTVSSQAWLSRATRVYKGVADLPKVMNKDKTLFQLDGIYYFQGPGPYVLDKPYTGRGVLVFEDDVTLTNFAPDPAAADAKCVVCAIPAGGKVDANSIILTSDVTADLLAPFGTVRAAGATPAIPTFTIRGSVMVRFLADALAAANSNYFESSTATPMLPTIDRGSKPEYEFEPAKPGASYNPAFAKHMQVFYDPGYVKKLYWSKRDRN